MKNRDKKIKRLLAGPYIIWAAGFIVIPLLMIFYYGLSDKSGHVTFHNIAQITTPENLKALGLALLLSLISTAICLVLGAVLTVGVLAVLLSISGKKPLQHS